MLIHRRSLLLGMGSLLASPAIVRATSIMPVKTMIWDGRVPVTIFNYGVSVGLGSYPTHAIQEDEWKVWDPHRGCYRYIDLGLYSGPFPSFLVDYHPHHKALNLLPKLAEMFKTAIGERLD